MSTDTTCPSPGKPWRDIHFPRHINNYLNTVSMHAEGLAYEDKPKFKNCSPPSLSPHTNARSSDLTQLEAVQTFPKGPKSTPSLMNNEKSCEDGPELKQTCSSLLLSPHTALRSSDSRHPKAIHLSHQVPAQLVEVRRNTSPSMASLHPNVKSLCCIPITLPPVHGEVSLSTMKQLSGRKAVNKDEETNMPKGLPIPLAALLLPKQTPISSLRAAPSRSPEDELKQHLLMVTGQHKSTNVDSPIPTARINACQATNPDAHSQASNKVINSPGVSLPFWSKLKLPVNMPPDQVEVFPPTK